MSFAQYDRNHSRDPEGESHATALPEAEYCETCGKLLTAEEIDGRPPECQESLCDECSEAWKREVARLS